MRSGGHNVRAPPQLLGATNPSASAFVGPAGRLRNPSMPYRPRPGTKLGRVVGDPGGVRARASNPSPPAARAGPVRLGSAPRAPRVKLHPNSTPAERHPLHPEPESLFPARDPGERDPAAGGHHPVPRQRIVPLERPNREARGSGKPGGGRNLTVGDHPAPGDLGNHPAEPNERGQLSPPPTRSVRGFARLRTL